jgi:hypothetical protein
MANPIHAALEQGPEDPVRRSRELAHVVDERQPPRGGVARKMWDYLRKHGPFQDSIVTDDGRVLVGAEAWAELDRFIDRLQRDIASDRVAMKELLNSLRASS